MKRIASLVVKSLAPILIGSGTFALTLQAQSDVSITAAIPFPFTVGAQSIAPGTYQFSLISSPFMLSVVNVKTGDKDMFAVRPEQQRSFESRGRLVFRNSEGSSVLSEVHFPGTRMFSEVALRHGSRRIEAKKSSNSSPSAGYR